MVLLNTVCGVQDNVRPDPVPAGGKAAVAAGKQKQHLGNSAYIPLIFYI